LYKCNAVNQDGPMTQKEFIYGLINATFKMM